MVGLLLLFVTGQFDFGGGTPPRSKNEHIGQELLMWDVVQSELKVKTSAVYDAGTFFGGNPMTWEPVLVRGSFRDDVYLTRSFTELTRGQWSRLRQIYVQYKGSAAVNEPEIAKELRLTSAQRARVRSVDKVAAPFFLPAFGSGTGFFQRPKNDGPDAKIARHLDITEILRRGRYNQMTRRSQALRQYQAILTDAQRRKLKAMGGAPIKAALYENAASLGLPAARPTQTLRYEGVFSVLRHDVAEAIGLDETTIDRLMLDLERLYLDASHEADEYWWLLKQPEKRAEMLRLRQVVFQRYELLARKKIRDALTPTQLAKWEKLAGPVAPGLKTRNHFG